VNYTDALLKVKRYLQKNNCSNVFCAFRW